MSTTTITTTSKTTSRVWLIVGTSTGFGREFVKSVLHRGEKVIATARSLDKIQDLKELGAHTMQLDVTSDQGTLNLFAEQAIGVYGHVDILINNAAYVLNGTIEESTHEETQHLFNTNVFGLLNTTRAILPHFRERKSGIIVNISSIGGIASVKVGGLYCATKFAVEAISEALKDEVAHLGIKVVVVEPGYFRTDLLSSSNMKDAKKTISDYEPIYKEVDFHAVNHKQRGDPVKLSERLVDVLTQSGVAAGREIPFRIPFGVDAYPFIEGKCQTVLKEMKEWEDVIKSTDHDDVTPQQ